MNDAPAEREDRLARWVREHSGAVFGYLFASVRHRATAEDLLQEVLFRAWKASAHYRERGAERAYLLSIADRLLIDERRRDRLRGAAELADFQQIAASLEGPEAPLERADAERALAESMAALSEPQRQTILLRFYGEMSFAEIAKVMGCPLGTALSHCRRGLSSLRRILQEKVR